MLETHAELEFYNVGVLKIAYDTSNLIPIGLGKNLTSGGAPETNLALLSSENQNLSPSQKLLLE